MLNVNIDGLHTNQGAEAVAGSQPFFVNRNGNLMRWEDQPGHAYPQITTPRGMVVNSLLRKDEWEQLDEAIVQAASKRLNGIMHLRERNLTFRLGGIGSLLAQYNQASEMTEAAITIDGHTTGDRDRVDFNLVSVPVPVIHKEYSFGARELAGARNMGNAVETGNAEAAARVVAEGLENMLFNGNADVVLNGNSIYGYTTEPSRNTDTASNYGGGDWGTATNPEKTVGGMIDAAQGDNYYGPYLVYAATTQYNEAATTYTTDGSGDTGADRIRRMAEVEGFFNGYWLDAGEIALVQASRDVVDLAFVPGFELANLEWTSGDGMKSFFKVVTIAVPRVKSEYSGKSGIVIATGA